MLFCHKLNDQVLNFSQQVPKDPNSFQRKWSFTTYWDQHEEIMIQHYLNLLRNVDYVDPNAANMNPFGNRAFHQVKAGPGLMSYLDVRKLFFSEIPESEKIKPLIEEEYRGLTRCTGVIIDPNMQELEKLTSEAPLEIMSRLKENFVKFFS